MMRSNSCGPLAIVCRSVIQTHTMPDVNRTDIQNLQDEKRTAVFQVRMRPSVKAAGEKAAAADNRSLASLMEMLLIEHLRARRYLGHPPVHVARGPEVEDEP
jgi:hypothetical protein